MSDIITEALLEMHFHRKIIEAFSYVYGAKFLKIIKPSSRRESWIGFDQGWVRTSLSQEEFFSELKKEIQNKGKTIKKFYFGYFLQFKRVQEMKKRSSLSPPGQNTPYYRSELSLSPNKNTGLSQHETLLILNNIKNTVVDYCCPMIFEIDELYEDPDSDKLRIVSLDESPEGWSTNQPHFLIFQNKNDDNPLWYSDPIKGRSTSLKNWIINEYIQGPKKMTSDEIYNFIIKTKEILYTNIAKRKRREQFYRDYKFNILPESMTIVQFENGEKIDG